MTTITRERLLKIQKWRETYGPGCNVVLPAEEAEELARIALASLEAEPVAWTEKCEITNMQAIGLYLRGFPDNSQGRDIALYAAPPAPVVSDEIKRNVQTGWFVGPDGKNWSATEAHAWNKCSAAMLQGNQATIKQFRNVPVIPDCWIKCSERMPEESGRYWCYVEEINDLGKSHYQWNCSWNGERWLVDSDNGGRVTHWMPLPAAPQQEVKGE